MLVFILRVIPYRFSSRLIFLSFLQTNKITAVPKFVWQILLLGVALTAVVIVVLKGKSGREKEGYEAML